jgi:hypothetical protein
MSLKEARCGSLIVMKNLPLLAPRAEHLYLGTPLAAICGFPPTAPSAYAVAVAEFATHPHLRTVNDNAAATPAESVCAAALDKHIV